ncbi:hypothetical protein DNH61_19555 [Paenibacillus sambharensis]|uniref:YetF C-terminal domain-containing protein n=1 Tax=Paenibacillus sambharensis TaxID=1803190 RepID=A0A2W1LQN8_9BACL|nr:YetF domain-containing protein [Paenibacillus sambharensis]PZD94151.1 hypothetical protein DNH61_19555 [Paenibacillus sambharensis]
MYEVLLLLFLVAVIWVAALIGVLALLAGSGGRLGLAGGDHSHPYLDSHVSLASNRTAEGGKTAYRLEKLPLLLISEGKVIEENLRQTGKTRFWLNREVTLKGIKGIRQVCWCTINFRGELYILGDKNLS